MHAALIVFNLYLRVSIIELVLVLKIQKYINIINNAPKKPGKK